MGTIKVSTDSRVQWIDITAEVQQEVEKSRVEEGLAHVFVPHTTAGVTINENADPSVVTDVNSKLSELIPEADKYLHSEGNSDGHVKSSLVGASETVPVSNGRLDLGTWQGIYFCEFDGPRQRSVKIKVIST